MKKSTCLWVIVFLLSTQMMAQVNKPSTKPSAELPPDLEEAMKKMPADQRAAVEAIIAKLKSGGKKEEATKKNDSPIVEIELNQPLQVPTEAQAKDHLLWYKGKKINDSILVTTKAMVVLYSENQSKIIVKPPAKNDPFGKMANNASKESEMTEDYIELEAAKKNSFMNYPLIQITVDKFQDIDELYNSAIKNTIDLPEVPSAKPVQNEDKGGFIVNNFTPELELKALHNKLKKLLQNEPDRNFDEPPKENFSLENRCDKDEQEHFSEEVKKWQEKFTEYENNLMKSYVSINRFTQIAEDKKIKIDYDFTSLAADLEKAIGLFYSRFDEKISQLIIRYGKNIYMQSSIINTALAYERQKQLLGQHENGPNVANDAIQLFVGPEFENYINEQIEKKNWDIILNYSMILGRARTLQLLGLSEEASDRLGQLYNKIIKLNRFALTLDIDFNLQISNDDGEVGLKANGKIQTKDKVYVCLAPIECKWTLRQTEVDYEKDKNASYIPMQVTEGIKSVKDENNKFVDLPYSGSKDMIMYFPVFRIDFSDKNEQDSATLGALKYPPNASIDINPMGNSYKADILSFLNYVFIVFKKTAANEKEAEVRGKEMLNKFSALTIMPNSASTLGKLKDQYLLMQQKQEMEKGIADIALTAKAVILFNAQNNSSILIDDIVDTKHKDEEIEVLKGLFKIKLVHDPIPN